MAYSEIPKKQKLPRLRFDHLRGDTAWARLITWMRRRRLHSFIVYSVILLLLYTLIGYAIYADSVQMNVDFWEESLPIFLLMSVYLLPWGWLLLWIAVPEKHHQIRRIKRLGNELQITAALEDDLSSPDGILYQKGSVLVTRRFIVDTSLFSFRLYPLEGLVRFDDISGVPVLYYKDGKKIRVQTFVSFKRLKSYINQEHDIPVQAKSTLQANNILSITLAVCIGLFIIIAALTDKGENFMQYLKFIIPGVIVCLLAYMFVKLFADSRRDRERLRLLSEVQDPDEKIRKLEELYNKGHSQNAYPEHLNRLSLVYYEKGDFDKALELIRNAHGLAADTKAIRIGRGMTAAEVYRMNEITYLTALKQTDDAERLLDALNENRFNNGVLYNFKTARARIAISKGDTLAAREFLSQAKALPPKGSKQTRSNLSWYLLLIEVECDLLERDEQAALSKLIDITSHCTYAPTVRRAEELKNNLGI